MLKSLLKLPKLVALCEVGLDYSTHLDTWKGQQLVLSSILVGVRKLGSKPVLIHCREPCHKYRASQVATEDVRVQRALLWLHGKYGGDVPQPWCQQHTCRRLLQPLHNVGHSVCGQLLLYNSLLAKTLSAECTQVVGTVRSNSGPSKRPGSAAYGKKRHGLPAHNQVLFLLWKDKRDIYMLTTKHLPTMTRVQSLTQQKDKPLCAVDYISNMAGVDKSDQISYLPLHHKTVK